MLIPMLLPRGRLDPQGKGVLITGCDTGFGLLLAKRLHEIGMTVYAGKYNENNSKNKDKTLTKLYASFKNYLFSVKSFKNLKRTAEIYMKHKVFIMIYF